jgi:hypothetical protein
MSSEKNLNRFKHKTQRICNENKSTFNISNSCLLLYTKSHYNPAMYDRGTLFQYHVHAGDLHVGSHSRLDQLKDTSRRVLVQSCTYTSAV